MSTPRRPPVPRRLLPASLALALFALAIAAGSLAQPPKIMPSSPAFIIIGEYQLELDGAVDDEARIYHSQGRASILVRSPELTYNLELQPRSQAILAWPDDQLVINDDGTVEVRGQGKPGGTFELVRNLPVFDAEGKKIRFLIRPPVVGAYDSAALRKTVPVYAERARLYEPQPTYMAKIKELEPELHIRLFFGTWCKVCTEMMPRVLSTEDELERIGIPITFEYYGVAPGFEDPEAQRLGVRGLPTGILYKDGKELGRVVGHGWSFPSMAIYNQLIEPTDQTPPKPTN